jgi:AcrR family transcriptional regulator
MNETRQRLIDGAREVVRDRGLMATSREITAAAGANLAAITYHFGSKEQLVTEALLDGLRRWLAPALDVLAGDGDPATRSLVAIDTLVSSFEEHRADAPAYLEALLQSPRMPDLHAGVVDLWSELRGSLAAQIEGLCHDGRLPAWTDPEAMAGLLVAVASGLVVQVTVDPEGPGLRAMAAQFGSLLVAAGHPEIG